MAKVYLNPLNSKLDTIEIDSVEFSLGRGLDNSYTFKQACISRYHCVFRLDGNIWTLTDKSTLGTSLNGVKLTKNEVHVIHSGDVISLVDGVTYKFHSGELNNNGAKRRRLGNHENDSKYVEETEQQIKKLEEEIVRNRAIIQKLKEEGKETQDKVVSLEIDLFNKVSSTVKLEQENEDLKSCCAALEKEREELQLQLTDFECLTNLLQLRLEKSQLPEKKSQASDSDSEDKNVLSGALRAEIQDKENSLVVKITQIMDHLKSASNSSNATGHEATISHIQKHLQELKSNLDELTEKRNELDGALKSCAESSSRKKLAEDMFEVMENDLQCSICNEVFVKASSLNCGHTFCKMCIKKWREQKNTCPVCRVAIHSTAQCIALDNYVEQILEVISPGKKEARAKLKETHEAALTSLTEKKPAEPRPRHLSISSVSSDDSDLEVDSDDYSDVSEEYFGGYGVCFICGDPRHWANSCPRRRR